MQPKTIAFSVLGLISIVLGVLYNSLPTWVQDLTPIFILLVVVSFVITRLPRIDVGHSDSYRARRLRNWLPVGLMYAFLYMGRYNLTVGKNAFGDLGMMTNADFGVIFGIGTLVYGCAFLINGPLTDRFGGKLALLVGGAGALVANLLMGIVTLEVLGDGPGKVTNALTAAGEPVLAALLGVQNLFRTMLGFEAKAPEESVLLPSLAFCYAMNMYFQSFGAVAIVKVNASWFHVRERGVFGAIFGILISLGVYFAYDLNAKILDATSIEWIFLTPAALLALLFVLCIVLVKNTPHEAGHGEFDPADASSGDDGPRKSAFSVFAMMMRNPVIVTIACIEFCSGFLRQAIMQWGKIYTKQTGVDDSFVAENWGMLLCCAGILGGVFAGTISDHIFGSRRGPVAAFLYAMMLVGAIGMCFLLGTTPLLWMLIFLSIAVIGVHGMLSGTASMDFGGRKNAGVAVGIIDGFVYLGTAVMSFWYGWRLPDGDAAADPDNWSEWPLWMIPIALIGLVLALKIWNARPQPKKG